MPRKPKAPARVETRGRKPIPESLRRQPFRCRLPQRVIDGLHRLAALSGSNSPGIEIERLYDESQTRQREIISL